MDTILGFLPYDWISNFDNDSVKDSASDSSPVFISQSYGVGGEDVFSSQPVNETAPSVYYNSGHGIFYAAFSSEPSGEMQQKEGFLLTEWRAQCMQNATRLEEKKKKEKEMLQQMVEEAEEYKKEFYRKHQLTIEKNKASNREKGSVTNDKYGQLLLANREKFHAEAEKNYWKAVGDLIPHVIPAVETKKRNKGMGLVAKTGPASPSGVASTKTAATATST